MFKGVKICKANFFFLLFYFTAQSRMKNQCFNRKKPLCQYKLLTKTDGWAKNRSDSNPLYFLFFLFFYYLFCFFYNPCPPCQLLKAECKASCLNKPDYRY